MVNILFYTEERLIDVLYCFSDPAWTRVTARYCQDIPETKGVGLRIAFLIERGIETFATTATNMGRLWSLQHITNHSSYRHVFKTSFILKLDYFSKKTLKLTFLKLTKHCYKVRPDGYTYMVASKLQKPKCFFI